MFVCSSLILFVFNFRYDIPLGAGISDMNVCIVRCVRLCHWPRALFVRAKYQLFSDNGRHIDLSFGNDAHTLSGRVCLAAIHNQRTYTILLLLLLFYVHLFKCCWRAISAFRSQMISSMAAAAVAACCVASENILCIAQQICAQRSRALTSQHTYICVFSAFRFPHLFGAVLYKRYCL